MSTYDPTGLGLYIRGLSKKVHGTPKQAAKKAVDHDVEFVAIMTMWQEYKNGKFVQYLSNGKSGFLIKDYAEAFADAGIQVYLWGFPWGGHEEAFIERFVDVTEFCDEAINGWLYDPELGYKWTSKKRTEFSGMRKQPEYTKGVFPTGSAATRKKQAAKLKKLTLDAMDESLNIGVTSYGMAQYHKNFPWIEFGGLGFGSPQFYTVGPEQIDQGISQWREHGWRHIVVSAPTFGRNSGPLLHDYLSNFIDSVQNVDGIILWSWRQTSSDEWRIVGRIGDWFKRRIFDT